MPSILELLPIFSENRTNREEKKNMMDTASLQMWIYEELRGIVKPEDLRKKKLEVLTRKKKDNGYERKLAGEISERMALQILLDEIDSRLKKAGKR